MGKNSEKKAFHMLIEGNLKFAEFFENKIMINDIEELTIKWHNSHTLDEDDSFKSAY